LKSGDEDAREVLGRAGSQTGQVLAGVCNAVGPNLVVIGGELAEAGEALLSPLEEALREQVIPSARRRLHVRKAALGEGGGALGAIALVLHESPLLARYPDTADTEKKEDDYEHP
jgi:predicted NBD/HSP70 family sugar kinase